MTYDYNFDAMRRDLIGTAHVTNSVRVEREVARIHALATLALAESVAQLVAWNAPTQITLGDASAQAEVALERAEPERAPEPVERDWRMGDVVTLEKGDGEWHVEAVGIDQGGTALTLINEKGETTRLWTEYVTFIRHDAAEVLDADFAEAANAGRKSDAFAAAKAKTKKAKS